MKLIRIIYKFGFFAVISFTVLSCCDTESQNGDLNLSFNLMYNGEPLVMFQDYVYPDGRTINFSKFSIYTSDIKLDDNLISDVAFHNLTNSHVNLDDATVGYEWMINDIEPNLYTNLSFGVGVNAVQNAIDPGVFESGHPLAKPAEHWFSWSSFIFLKLEANLDTNGDGVNDLPIALHLGDDDAYRIISLDNDIEIKAEEVTNAKIEIDIYNFLGGAQNTYDVDAVPQIHLLEQIDAVVELANNLDNTFQ